MGLGQLVIAQKIKHNQFVLPEEDRDFLSSLCKDQYSLSLCEKILFLARQTKRPEYIQEARSILKRLLESKNGLIEKPDLRSEVLTQLFEFFDRFYIRYDHLRVLNFMLTKSSHHENFLLHLIPYLKALLRNEISYTIVRDPSNREKFLKFVELSLDRFYNKCDDSFRPEIVIKLLEYGPIDAIIENCEWFFKYAKVFLIEDESYPFSNLVFYKGAEKEKEMTGKAIKLMVQITNEYEGKDDVEFFLQRYWHAFRFVISMWHTNRYKLIEELNQLFRRVLTIPDHTLRKELWETITYILRNLHGLNEGITTWQNILDSLLEYFKEPMEDTEKLILILTIMLNTEYLKLTSSVNLLKERNIYGIDPSNLREILLYVKRTYPDLPPRELAYATLLFYWWRYKYYKVNLSDLKSLFDIFIKQDNIDIKKSTFFVLYAFQKLNPRIKSSRYIIQKVWPMAEVFINYARLLKYFGRKSKDEWFYSQEEYETLTIYSIIYRMFEHFKGDVLKIHTIMKSFTNEELPTATFGLLLARELASTYLRNSESTIDSNEKKILVYISRTIMEKIDPTKTKYSDLNSLASKSVAVAIKSGFNREFIRDVFAMWQNVPDVNKFSILLENLDKTILNENNDLTLHDFGIFKELARKGIVPTAYLIAKAKKHGIGYILKIQKILKQHGWEAFENTKSREDLSIMAELFGQSKNNRFVRYSFNLREILDEYYDDFVYRPKVAMELFSPVKINVSMIKKSKFNARDSKIVETIKSHYIRARELATHTKTEYKDLLKAQIDYDMGKIDDRKLLETYVKYLRNNSEYGTYVLDKIETPKWLYVLLSDAIPEHCIDKVKADKERIQNLKKNYASIYKNYNLDWSSYDSLLNSIDRAIGRELKERKRGFKRRFQQLGKFKSIVEIRINELKKDIMKLEGALKRLNKEVDSTNTVSFRLIARKSLADLFAGAVSSDCTLQQPGEFFRAFLAKAWNIKIVKEDENKWVGNLYLLEVGEYWVIDALQFPFANYFNMAEFWEKIIKILKKEAHKRNKKLAVSEFRSNYREVKDGFTICKCKKEKITLPRYTEPYKIFESAGYKAFLVS